MKKHELFLLIFFIIQIIFVLKSYYMVPFFLVAFFLYILKYGLRDSLFILFLSSAFFFVISAFSFHSSGNRVKWIFERGESKVALTYDGKHISVSDTVEVGDRITKTGEILLKGGISQIFYRKRFGLAQKIEEIFDYPVSSLIQSITLGVRFKIPESLKAYMLLSGTYPFLAISGLHIGVVFGLFWFLFRTVGFKNSSLLSLASVTAIFPFTGFPVSAVRAYFMLLFVFFLKYYGRRIDYLYLLLFTGVVMVIFEITPGFILSFLAVSGIIYGLGAEKEKKFFSLIFPFLFTSIYVLVVFKVINLFSSLLIFLISPLFVFLLIMAFISEITLFKVPVINFITEKTGEYFILLIKEIFSLAHLGVIYSSPPILLIYLMAFIVFVAILFNMRRVYLLFVFILFFLYLSLSRNLKITDTVRVDGKRLNSAYFIAGEAQGFKNSTFVTDYCFPFAFNVLAKNGNRVIIRK